jgi:hypothetical protein
MRLPDMQNILQFCEAKVFSTFMRCFCGFNKTGIAMGRLGEIQIIDVDIEMFKFQYRKVHNSNLDGYTPRNTTMFLA